MENRVSCSIRIIKALRTGGQEGREKTLFDLLFWSYALNPDETGRANRRMTRGRRSEATKKKSYQNDDYTPRGPFRMETVSELVVHNFEEINLI